MDQIEIDSPHDSSPDQASPGPKKQQDQTAAKQNHNYAAVLDKDSDEEDLERFVFSDSAGFRQQLLKDHFLDSGEPPAAAATASSLLPFEGPDNDDTGFENIEDADLFVLDTTAAPLGPGIAGDGKWPAPASALATDAGPAWEDSDDERITVSLAGASRLRKLRIAEGEDVVSGTEYTRRLRIQYLRLSPMPGWAREAAGLAGKKRQRRRSASDSDSEAETDSEDFSTQPLAQFLRNATSLAAVGPKKRRRLRPETLDIQRSRDIAVTHAGPVTSLAFHPTQPILLSSSPAGLLHLNLVDPAAHPTPNPEILSVRAKHVSVRHGEFLGPDGAKVFFAGRRAFIHRWDLNTGLVQRTAQMLGHKREHKSMEHFKLSPCGRWVAIKASARKGGGIINIVNAVTMQWVAAARLDSRHGIADFAWWGDGAGLAILGRDGSVGEWNLEQRSFVAMWEDEGCVGGIVVALGGRNQGPAVLGGDRWVAVGSNSGIMNLYDRHSLCTTPLAPHESAAAAEAHRRATPTRTFEQMVTPVTTIAFSADGSLLAFASQPKKDSLRLVHLPSCTVYRNWPTQQTPLGRVTSVAFGSDGAVLVVGNDSGKVRMWEIRG